MNKLKFRSWSGKRFYYWGFIDGYFVSPIYIDDVICKEVMQFTGLKDANGKEIYECDFIKHKTGEISCVRWNDKVAGFEFVLCKNWDPKTYFNSDFSEIIGNTYENPELLENQK